MTRALLCLLLLLPLTVGAETMSSKAFAACLVRAAKHYNVPVKLLAAIKIQESGRRINGDIVRRNKNGTRDIGPMQINSTWLKTLRRYGIGEAELRHPCINVYVGAWILKNEINRHGLVKGIAYYHSPTPKYQKRYLAGIGRILRSFQ